MANKHKPRELRRGDGYVTTRINKDGSVTAQARWLETGLWRAKSFRGMERDKAVELAEDHLRFIGRLKRSGRFEPESRLTVGQAVDAYMERGKRKWVANTYSTYRGVHTLHIAPYIGHMRLGELTPLRVQHWVDTITHKGLSASVIENARGVLNGACKDAIRMGVITHNPVTGVSMPARTRHKYVVWTVNDVQAVMAASADDLRMATYYAVALTTAMRPGEIRALSWADIDMERTRVTVRRTITRDERGHQVLGDTTKTGKTRTIALAQSTVEALRKWRKHQNERRLRAAHWRDLDLVFDRGDGNVLPQNTVTRAHQRLSADAGVPIIRLHDLRHTSASLLVDAGTHIKVVSDILGHSSVAITMDIYSHPDESIQRAATEVLSDILKRRV